MLDAFQHEFMRNALMAGLLASIACGIVGAYVVSKRIVFISGGISHTAFGGIGLGYLLGTNPIVCAIFFCIATAVLIGLVSRNTREREDSVIGILWAMGMALGIIFIGLTPGYAPDLFSYLFGNILTVPHSDLLLMVGMDAAIIFSVLLFYKEFLAISFDEDFATAVGVPVGKLNILLLMLVALTVVVLIRVVGVTLVIALLTIPAAIAGKFTNSLRGMMLLAIVLGVVFTSAGLALSYTLNLASGATIILVGGTAYILSFLKK